jgi:hypothetical protein
MHDWFTCAVAAAKSRKKQQRIIVASGRRARCQVAIRGYGESAKAKKKRKEITRLPWRGQCGRAGAGSAALSLRCAASASADVYTVQETVPLTRSASSPS